MADEKISVLLIDDDPTDAHLVGHALKKFRSPSFQVDVATSLAEARQHLANNSYDVALLDLGLPESVGLETVSNFRQLCPHSLPVVVLAGMRDDAAAFTSLSQGAQDHIVKNQIQTDALPRAIRHAILRQRMMNQLHAVNQGLERKNQRLAELYNTAQQFVDNVSHEFRTPLTVIREFASIVRDGYDGPVTPKQIEHLDKVLHRTDDLALMVDDMLDISKLEAGLLGVWRRPCHVEQLIESVGGSLRARAESKGIQLAYSFPADLPEIFADEEKLQRVLINLTVNAIKFTPEGGRVTITARLADGGADVLVAISDTGPGISPRNLNVIFERFQDVEMNLRASTKGFGLGLNIAKGLVQLNLGWIHVASELGAGSTFSFTVPCNNPRVIIERYLERLHDVEQKAWVSTFTVAIDADDAASAVPVVDEFLQRSVRGLDLVRRADDGQWVLAATCPEHDAPTLIKRLQSAWERFSRNFPSSSLPELRFTHHETYSASADDSDEVRCALLRLGGWADAPIDPAMSAFSVAHNMETKNGPMPPTVLVIDDDEELRSCLGVRLRAAGYQMLSARDGEEGLAAAIEKHPDAVVLDIRMPNKDGISVLHELRTDEHTKRTPVVMLSANIRCQQQALEAGADYFVSKPYEAKDVLSAIESSLRERCLP